MAVYALIGGPAVGLAASSRGDLLASCPLSAGMAQARGRAAGQIDASTDALLAPALALLPPGRAFAAAPGSVIHAAVDAISRDIGRVDAHVAALARQLVPGAEGELLPEWERAAGLAGDEEALPALIDSIVAQAVADAGGIAPAYPSLDLRRARAAAEMLAPSAPLSIDDLRRRALDMVLYRSTDTSVTPTGVETGCLLDVEVVRHLPCRAGVGRAGDPLYGDDWAFRYDVTLVGGGSLKDAAAVWTCVLERGQLFLAWVRRAWPPWCGLTLWARHESSPESLSVLTINVEEDAQ